jgi:hypothetical protein
MAQLLVDAVRCVEETDEIGSDDVYLMIFRGETIKPFNSNVGVHGPEGFWGDFDTGQLRNTDVAVAKFFSTSAYVVMLVEEDHARDISGAEVLGEWRFQCGATWRAAMISLGTPVLVGQPASPAQVAAACKDVGNTMQGLCSIYMSFPKGDDDAIGAPQQVKIAPGQMPVRRQSYVDHIGC